MGDFLSDPSAGGWKIGGNEVGSAEVRDSGSGGNVDGSGGSVLGNGNGKPKGEGGASFALLPVVPPVLVGGGF